MKIPNKLPWDKSRGAFTPLRTKVQRGIVSTRRTTFISVLKRGVLLPPNKFFFIILIIIELCFSRVKITGNSLNYLHKEEAVKISGNAKLVNNDNVLKASRMTVYRAKKVAIASGNVRFNNSVRKTKYKGGYIRYNYKIEKITATGHPEIENSEEKIKVRADKIVGYVEKEEAYAYSNVIVNIYGQNKAVISGDRGVYFRNNSLFIMYGDVWLTNYSDGDTNIINAGCIKYIDSEKGDQIYRCLSNVIIYNAGENTEIKGQLVVHYPDRKITHITGNPTLINKEENITMSASWFEIYDDQDKMLAKGNVKVVSDDYTARSSWATYDIDSQMASLRGNPYVESDDNVFYSEEVIFDMKNQKMQMRRQINGSMKNATGDDIGVQIIR